MGIFENMIKPKGKLGNIQLKSMNKEHTPVVLWNLKHLDIKSDDIVLDVGCGGGININRMASKAKKYMALTTALKVSNCQERSMRNTSARERLKCLKEMCCPCRLMMTNLTL